MGFIQDNKINIRLTNQYREKLMRGKICTPTYFSLIDDEINYNLVNRFDNFVGNEGYELNSVTADQDSNIFSLPILEPTDIVYSKLYGYVDLPGVVDIDQIGKELTEEQNQFSKSNKYILLTKVDTIESPYNTGNNKIVINDVLNQYSNLFNITCTNQLYLYNHEDNTTEDQQSILQLYTGGDVINDYGLYNGVIVNRNTAEKQIDNNTIMVISSNIDTTARGMYYLPNSEFYPSHKTYLHLFMGNINKSVIIDVTNIDMLKSKTFNFNIFNIFNYFNYSGYLQNINIEMYFESLIKVAINNSYYIMRATSDTVVVEASI